MGLTRFSAKSIQKIAKAPRSCSKLRHVAPRRSSLEESEDKKSREQGNVFFYLFEGEIYVFIYFLFGLYPDPRSRFIVARIYALSVIVIHAWVKINH